MAVVQSAFLVLIVRLIKPALKINAQIHAPVFADQMRNVQ